MLRNPMLLIVVAMFPMGAAELTVYVRPDSVPMPVVLQAKTVAARIFKSIGVNVVWRTGDVRPAARLEDVTIGMQLYSQSRPSMRPGAIAYATPFANSGTRINVMCDRVFRMLSANVGGTSRDQAEGSILGHVMAHEIAHVLEGMNRHSDLGLMKAGWQPDEIRQMVSGILPFDAVDTRLILAGLGSAPSTH